MGKWLFYLFYATVFLAVAVTTIGLLANWGIWIESPLVQEGQELPLLKELVRGVIIAIIGVVIDISRRILIISRSKDEISKIYIDLIGVSTLLPTSNRDEANINYQYLDEYMEKNSLVMDEELKSKIREEVKNNIQKHIHTRYGGAQKLRIIPEVLPKTPSA